MFQLSKHKLNATGFSAYFAALDDGLQNTVITDRQGAQVGWNDGLGLCQRTLTDARAAGRSVFFCGNGGSSAVASHLRVDFLKNGGFSCWTTNDPAVMTCLGNDYCFEDVFSRQIDMLARPGDVGVIISSSGNSENIRRAAAATRRAGAFLITLSGFGEDNKLRALGDVNFYVPGDVYGLVEIAHLAVGHALLDLGFLPPAEPGAPAAADEEAGSPGLSPTNL